MVGRLPSEAAVTRTSFIENLHEGRYAAEVQVELIETDGGFSPYYSPDDVRKLERVQDALRRGDVLEASKEARVFELLPLAG